MLPKIRPQEPQVCIIENKVQLGYIRPVNKTLKLGKLLPYFLPKKATIVNNANASDSKPCA